PQRYILLGYTIDSRTGAGKAFQGYFHLLLQLLKTTPIEEILEHPKVAERVQAMRENDRAFRQALQQYSRQDGNVIITDFREAPSVPPGNRFLVYTLYPQANVSLRIHWGPQRQSVIAAVGHSIFNRTCQTSVGDLMARFGGGGHHGAGTVPLKPDVADAQLQEIIDELKANG
ncbi:MAG: exopolyphosphatase, partial [Candidatus Dadabacteria bacterium]